MPRYSRSKIHWTLTMGSVVLAIWGQPPRPPRPSANLCYWGLEKLVFYAKRRAKRATLCSLRGHQKILVSTNHTRKHFSRLGLKSQLDQRLEAVRGRDLKFHLWLWGRSRLRPQIRPSRRSEAATSNWPPRPSEAVTLNQPLWSFHSGWLPTSWYKPHVGDLVSEARHLGYKPRSPSEASNEI